MPSTTSSTDPVTTGRLGGLLDRVRQPEYTGENRCPPCTAVNTAIAAGLTAGAFAVSPLLAPPVAVASGAAIWLRGYLVPGTPTLTARYMPEWMLAWFGKAGAGSDSGPTTDADEPVDVAGLLHAAGAVRETADGTDLELTPAFRSGWRERMAGMDRERDAESLAAVLGVDPEAVEFQYVGGAVVAHGDGYHVGQWESRAAFVADVAAAAEIEAIHPAWADLGARERSETLGGLRLFLEACPACEGTVAFEQTVVRSCCRETDVLALSCRDCGARLLETPVDPAEIDELVA